MSDRHRCFETIVDGQPARVYRSENWTAKDEEMMTAIIRAARKIDFDRMQRPAAASSEPRGEP